MPKVQSQAEKAVDQVVDWLEHFEPVDDPRRSGKVWYRIDEVLLLCQLAVLAGAESWVEVVEFGKRKLAFLRRFRPFKGDDTAVYLRPVWVGNREACRIVAFIFQGAVVGRLDGHLQFRLSAIAPEVIAAAS